MRNLFNTIITHCYLIIYLHLRRTEDVSSEFMGIKLKNVSRKKKQSCVDATFYM